MEGNNNYNNALEGEKMENIATTFRDLHEKFMSTPNAVRSAEEIDKMARGLNEDT